MSETLEILVRAFERMAESHRLLASHLERRLQEQEAARAALEGRIRDLEQAYRALMDSSLELGQRAARLEGELATLKAENARLRDLDRRRVDLLATVAHELRTPLTSVSGALDVLRSGQAEPGSQPDLLALAHMNTQRLTRLMATLLDLARLEAGEFGLDRKAVDLGELVEQAAEILRGVAREREIAITVARPRALAPLWGDAERLKSVAVNLLENALKHSRPGGSVAVEVADRGAEVLVTVTDEGPGIAPEDLEHIFDRFYRGPGERPGAGLGLYICRVILEEHGGRIWAEALARGTRFSFVVPRPQLPSPATIH